MTPEEPILQQETWPCPWEPQIDGADLTLSREPQRDGQDPTPALNETASDADDRGCRCLNQRQQFWCTQLCVPLEHLFVSMHACVWLFSASARRPCYFGNSPGSKHRVPVPPIRSLVPWEKALAGGQDWLLAKDQSHLKLSAPFLSP